MGQANHSKAEIRKRKTLRNRIFIVLVVMGVLYIGSPLLVGDMRMSKYFSLIRTYHKISSEIKELNDENKRLRGEVAALRSDPTTIERIARNELGLVKEGELVYHIRPAQK